MRVFKNDLRILHIAARCVAACGLLLGALVGLPALAQPSPATAPVPRVVYPLSPVGNSVKLGVATADAANAANFSFGAAANGSVFGNTTGYAPTPGGKSIPIGVTGRIPAAAIGPALARFAARTFPLLVAGVALYDLAKELGYESELKPDGTPNFYQLVSINIYDWKIMASPGYHGASGADVCNSWQVGSYPLNIYTHRFTQLTETTGKCELVYTSVNRVDRTDSMSATVTSGGAHREDRTIADLVASEQAKVNYNPSTSALPRVVRDLINSGEEFQVSPETVTGPSTVPNPVVRTEVTPAQNGQPQKTTTETTTTTVTYAGDTITYNDTKVTVYNDGATTTTKTETKEPDEKPDECALNPDLLRCKGLDTPGDKVPSATKTITFAEEATGLGAGSCPAPVSVSTSKWSGSVSFQAECDFITTYVRPVVIAFAFLAAFFIVAPVKTE